MQKVGHQISKSTGSSLSYKEWNDGTEISMISKQNSNKLNAFCNKCLRRLRKVYDFRYTGKHSNFHLSFFQVVDAWRDFTVVTKPLKNFKSLYCFGGRCLKIRDVCINFEPCFKARARNYKPLPLVRRDKTLPYALFLFIGKCMKMIIQEEIKSQSKVLSLYQYL